MGTINNTDIINLEDQAIPLLPLRDIVVFPHTVIPLFIGREQSVNAVTAAMSGNKHILLVTQKKEAVNNPSQSDLYQVGTMAVVLQMLKLPDNTIKVLVEGVQRVKIKNYLPSKDFYLVQFETLGSRKMNTKKLAATMRLTLEAFEKYTKLNKKIPEEILQTLNTSTDVERISDVIISHISLKLDEKQKLLENKNALDRLEKVLSTLMVEIDVLNIEQKIHNRIRKQMETNQRDYYLNEQMKSIQKELGHNDEENEIEEFESKIKKAKLPKEVKTKATSELAKLRRMSSQSSDAAVIRTYLDNLCEVPWYKKTKINKNLKNAQVVLDNDHYGLDKVKERILEYLAVQNRVNTDKANILCLVGPPGVGKTSLGESIARAVNRKFIRMALGGVRDEAEIRGHRRTYIGAMPGTIVQKMQKVKVKNPLFLLDEIDKMGIDFRGDPTSALLEVLDPEQNHTFNDHYLEVDYDLSQIMFVTTANSTNISEPLLDRMEVIRLSGYTEDEKLEIAKRHLMAKEMKNNGLKKSEIEFKDKAILEIIRYYTSESGVRHLTREISNICRKVVKNILLQENKAIKIEKKTVITDKKISTYLGVRKYRFGMADDKNRVGEVTGLAWTQVGGDLLTIEAIANKGKGKLNYTGRLGDIMQESIQAAMAVIRARTKILSIDEEFYHKFDIHVHLPDGATPKDGPSAGVAICTAIASALTNQKVNASIAMTGEITLRGEITPIGGLKEKLLAALRGGIKKVLIPKENERELSEVPDKIKNKLEIIKVQWIDEVFNYALESKKSSTPTSY